MKAKKLLAALGVLVVALPGAAFASTQETVELVTGHTVFAAVVDETQMDFAAIAGIAAKRTTIGGVLWFNDQELLPSTVASEIAAGAYVIATEAGDDAPSSHMDAAYAESYQFTDPNNRVWIVDRYTYDVCSVLVAGDFHIVPCEAQGANQHVDLDGDGTPDDFDGDGNPDPPEQVVVVTKSLYVVEIGATTLDAASSCGTSTGKEYNFVLMVRMDSFGGLVADGASHDAANTDGIEGGNSHSGSLTPAPDHTHDTAQIDLWFSEERPAEPAARTMLFADTDGDTAPCYAP